MAINGKIVNQISRVPYNSSVLTFHAKTNPDSSNGDARELNNQLSFPYEGFLNGLQRSASSLLNRSFPSVTLNPDFNLLSANGLNPVTPAQGSNFEALKNWFVVNGGGGNNYTMTPTAYTQLQYAGTGSRYYLNMQIPSLDSPLYLYNLNYSLTDQFNNVGAYNRKKLTFSTIIKNNSSVTSKLRFSAFINPTSETVNGGAMFVKPGFNELATTISIPELKDIPIGSGAYAQLRFNIEDTYDQPLDMDLYYLKAELSNFATPLEVNHVLENLVCNNLV
jgi:hypothetical protein